MPAQNELPMDGSPLIDAGAGHNAPPDHGALAAQRMAEEYAGFSREVDELMAEAKNAPRICNDDETMGTLSKLVKRLRDKASTALTFHRTEKDPYYRAGQAVDRFFFGAHERLARREKTGKAGAADVLGAIVDDYMQRKLAEETRVRQAAERAAREAQKKLDDERIAAEKVAADALAAASRARKPENIDKHQTTAANAAAAAQDAKPMQAVMQERLVEATAAAAAKPSEMVGTRVSDDTKVTMRMEAYCDVTDVAALDKKTLEPFVTDDAWIAAAKAWAKVTQHKRQMAGASIGHRPKTVIR